MSSSASRTPSRSKSFANSMLSWDLEARTHAVGHVHLGGDRHRSPTASADGPQDPQSESRTVRDRSAVLVFPLVPLRAHERRDQIVVPEVQLDRVESRRLKSLPPAANCSTTSSIPSFEMASTLCPSACESSKGRRPSCPGDTNRAGMPELGCDARTLAVHHHRNVSEPSASAVMDVDLSGGAHAVARDGDIGHSRHRHTARRHPLWNSTRLSDTTFFRLIPSKVAALNKWLRSSTGPSRAGAKGSAMGTARNVMRLAMEVGWRNRWWESTGASSGGCW